MNYLKTLKEIKKDPINNNFIHLAAGDDQDGIFSVVGFMGQITLVNLFKKSAISAISTGDVKSLAYMGHEYEIALRDTIENHLRISINHVKFQVDEKAIEEYLSECLGIFDYLEEVIQVMYLEENRDILLKLHPDYIRELASISMLALFKIKHEEGTTYFDVMDPIKGEYMLDNGRIESLGISVFFRYHPSGDIDDGMQADEFLKAFKAMKGETNQ